jgi:hypothetical protein
MLTTIDGIVVMGETGNKDLRKGYQTLQSIKALELQRL